MKVTEIDYYLDGGSAKIVTDNGTYYFDRGLCSTSYKLYDKHMDEKNAQVIEDAVIKIELVDALRESMLFNGLNSGVAVLIEDIVRGRPQEDPNRRESTSRVSVFAEMNRNPDGTPVRG